MANKIIYVIITPVRDEASTIEETILSVINQSIKPNEWVIVNDNSTDDTFSIVSKYCKIYSWMRIINYPDMKERFPGAGVMKVFNYGVKQIEVNKLNYIVKMDADLSFQADYFEQMIKMFEQDSKLGLATGLVIEASTGKPSKRHEPDLTFGNIKMYKKEAFVLISPIEEIKGWDYLDNIKVQYYGYKSLIFPQYTVVHLKPLDSTVGYKKENYLKGYYDGYLKFNKIFVVMKFIKKMLFETPRILNGLYYIKGFLHNTIFVRDYYKDDVIIRHIRRHHKRRIFKALSDITGK